MNRMLLFLMVAVAALASGCDGEGGGLTVVTGVVRLEDTGEPLVGVSVSLKDSGTGFSPAPVAATTFTTEGGRYRVETTRRGNDGFLMIYANDDPYDARYSGGYTGEGVRTGKTKVLDITLSRIVPR